MMFGYGVPRFRRIRVAAAEEPRKRAFTPDFCRPLNDCSGNTGPAVHNTEELWFSAASSLSAILSRIALRKGQCLTRKTLPLKSPVRPCKAPRSSFSAEKGPERKIAQMRSLAVGRVRLAEG